MTETKRITCVVCPLGCEGKIAADGESIVTVEGFGCPRGEQYAREEAANPRRMLTTSVRVRGSDKKLLPVVSDRPIPKHLLMDCTALLMGVTVDAPIAEGHVVCRDILASGADIIAARGLNAAANKI